MTVPATPFIGSLSKAQFCTGSGPPIIKPVWTDLSNWDILDCFGWICRNLFHYHSGSLKKHEPLLIAFLDIDILGCPLLKIDLQRWPS